MCRQLGGMKKTELMKTFTEEQLRNVIAFLQEESERAFDLSREWEGSGVTYSDTDKLAEDVEYGRHEAFFEAAEALNKLIQRQEP